MTYLGTLSTGHKTLEGKNLNIDQIIDGATSKEDESPVFPEPSPWTELEDEVIYEGHGPLSPQAGPSSRSEPYIEPQLKRPRLALTVVPQKENVPPTNNGKHYFY